MMGPALREFMKDDLEASEAKGRKEGREEGREEGIRMFVDMCKGFGVSSTDAVEQIVSSLGVSRTEADKMVSKYW